MTPDAVKVIDTASPDTRGTGSINRLFHGYGPFKGAVEGRRVGVLLAMGTGEATEYDLWKLEERGPMFIDPGVDVYEGMLIGENSRDNDLDVNVTKNVKIGRFNIQPKVDVFNALNVSPVTAVLGLNYGTAAYKQPSVVLNPRTVQIGANDGVALGRGSGDKAADLRRFDARRQVDDYDRQYYVPAHHNWEKMAASGFEEARQRARCGDARFSRHVYPSP